MCHHGAAMRTLRWLFTCSVLLIAAPSAAQQAPPEGPVSLGIQTGVDAAMEEPALAVVTGPFLHWHLDEVVSLRLEVGAGYAPQIRSAPSGTPPWHARFLGDVRVSFGARLSPVVEGRVFASVRHVALQTHELSDSSADPPGGPLVIPDERDETWSTSWRLGGGTQLILRPEASRRLEVSASLGVAGVHGYRPDGSMGFARDYVSVFGTLSFGWLFF